MNVSSQVLALCGGVGGAKLALGLQRVLPPGALTVVANCGDDFEHLGLAISPDVDTILYTLSGLANPQTGWGRDQETWNFMVETERLGSETWFRLGDRDLALHVERTRRLAAGERLDAIVQSVARKYGLATRILPMSNDRVRTILDTDAGRLGFQEYFVRRSCVPAVRAIHYDGAETAQPTPGALDTAQCAAVVLCPSNPYLSIDPILSIAAWAEALRKSHAPVVAVSPIVAGEAVKGPTAKIMRELGMQVTPLQVARHYGELLDGFIIDTADAEFADQFDIPVLVTSTVMSTLEGKETLARETLAFARSLARADRSLR